MSTTFESPATSPTDGRGAQGVRMHSPPAFLDLADSAARLGSNMPDISARVELKRMEHERQRLLQRKMFEDQMRALEQQQQQELLSIPYDSSALHLAASAPTTPPRVNATLHGDRMGNGTNGTELHANKSIDADGLSKAVGFAADKRKSVTYAPQTQSPEMLSAAPGFGRAFGHKSMPASRRTSASSHDEELAGHLQNLSLIGEKGAGGAGDRDRASPLPGTPSLTINGRYGDDDGAHYSNGFNAGIMLDEQLDQEMHNAMRNLPTPADDKFGYASRVSPAALDLAPLAQTPPRGASFSGRGLDAREKASEWPQFDGAARGPESLAARTARRTATNPVLGALGNGTGMGVGGGDKLGGTMSAGGTPLLAQGLGSRRGSPLGKPDVGLSAMSAAAAAARSVPGTPMGGLSSAVAAHLMKSAGADTPELGGMNGRYGSQLGDGSAGMSELHQRLVASQYDGSPLTFNSIRGGLDDSSSQYSVDSVYNLSNGLDSGRYNGGSNALYGASQRYGLGIGSRPNGSVDGKMNGLHGPKHKRGEIDREFNRFAGTRLEDLIGEIPGLCKDQHGCRYLQKKLEEGIPEHRDIIFRETFGHFADLMTDPFGNYLCQKLLEFATDEQRNVICESVAQDLVNISLNMHGTRAVQKMIDFLSTRRQQTDIGYNGQIHSIIVALSLHVVVLIKDLNGNHVIQKCLNKLAPEDNQFIYNAVAQNCVEVATHRHGCCVLQRCIDHASDQQRVQLVSEITYNALTLVQDPYGNYVVQYILDLNDNRFSDGVIRQFAGNVCALSVQKFSSNVIEKCIRVAEHSTRKMLIDELLNRTRLEKLLRDSYGNYCVQTALDYAEPQQRALLVEGIRPVLPLIRNTPYGKRIQNKLQREQLDPFGGYQAQAHGHQQHMGGLGMSVSNGAAGMRLSPHSLAAAGHLPQLHQHQSGGMAADVYGAQNGIYSLGGVGVGGGSPVGMHAAQLHGLPMEGYVMQGGSPHSHAQASFGGASPFGSVSPFAGAGLSGSLNHPSYQRSAFGGYGM